MLCSLSVPALLPLGANGSTQTHRWRRRISYAARPVTENRLLHSLTAATPS